VPRLYNFAHVQVQSARESETKRRGGTCLYFPVAAMRDSLIVQELAKERV